MCSTAVSDRCLFPVCSLAIRPYNGPTNGAVAGAISKLRATVGGGKDVNISTQAYNKTENIVPPTSIVPADANALAFARTVAEVSNIVFLGGVGKVRDERVLSVVLLSTLQMSLRT